MADEESPYSPPNPLGSSWPKERLARVPEYKDHVVAQLREGIFISSIAEQLDINPRTIRNWREQDPEFDERCKDSEEYWVDRIDREMQNRALHGVAEVVLHPMTRQIVMDARFRDPVTGISTTPLILMKKSSADTHFFLRHRRPDIYGEKKTIDTNVSFDAEAIAESTQNKLRDLIARREKDS